MQTIQTQWTNGLTRLSALPLLLLGGCVATDPERPDIAPPAATYTAPPAPAGAGYPRLSIDGRDFETLGGLVRAIGEQGEGGGIVLVSGLEERPAPQVGVSRADYGKGLEQLIRTAGLLASDRGHYQFVYPPGYELLLGVSVRDQLAPRFQAMGATFAVGAGTDMYNALALLSETLGATVVADNAIADLWCGELFLQGAPVYALLEALLQSARVAPGAFVVEGTDRYVFIRSAANLSRPDACVNRDSLTPALRAALAKPVNLRVPPRGEDALQFSAGAAPLASVLPELSRQIGLAVSAPPEMAEFPVNQAVFLDMPVSDVLNLMVRQWPVARFGYRAGPEGIRFCTVDP